MPFQRQSYPQPDHQLWDRQILPVMEIWTPLKRIPIVQNNFHFVGDEVMVGVDAPVDTDCRLGIHALRDGAGLCAGIL
jgi:hypothetical protein